MDEKVEPLLDPEIYKKEYDIVDQFQEVLNGKQISKQDLFEKFEYLCNKYLKLLKTTLKLTKISDAYLKKLLVAKEVAENKNQELERAMAHIETLSGLLPICSSCKQIRDEDGEWNQIESYIASHSEAEFSHSLCPDCFMRLYPKYSDKI